MAKCNSAASANGPKGGPVSVASTLKEGGHAGTSQRPGGREQTAP